MVSLIGEEVPTQTSEDLGFESLGSKYVLPGYADNEIPPAALDNLAIDNNTQRYIACCGGKAIVGSLQDLRDSVCGGQEVAAAPIWEKSAVAATITVGFLDSGEAMIAAENGHITLLSFDGAASKSEVVIPLDEGVSILQLTQVHGGQQVLFLDSQHRLALFDLFSHETTVTGESVYCFALDFCAGRQLVVALTATAIVSGELAHPATTIVLNATTPYPDEITQELREENRIPLSVSVLDASGQLLLAFGNDIPQPDDDVFYDNKTYVVNWDPLHENQEPTFAESLDIAPSFGSIRRYPNYYNITLDKLVDNTGKINIISSAVSSELTIWDGQEVMQPDQDSERAVLPISESTDNDMNPVGVALDYSSSGIINQPCPGVESVEKLPLVYVLTNDGLLLIFAFYHSRAIKENRLHMENLGALTNQSNDTTKTQGTFETIGDSAQLNTAQSDQQPAKLPVNATETDDITSSVNSFKFGTEQDSDKQPATTPAFGAPSFQSNDNPFSMVSKETTVTEESGAESTFGKPAFDSSSFNTSKVAPQQNTDNNSTETAAFGKPAFGAAPASTAPAFGSSTFGSGAFGGNSTSNDNTSSSTAFGKPAFGSTGFASVAKESTTSGAFGKPAIGSSGFGTTVNEASTTTTSGAFGKPTFGSSGFGATVNEANKTTTAGAFGIPAFGSSGFGATINESKQTTTSGAFGAFGAFGKPAFGSNGPGENANASPFASLANSSASSGFAKAATGASPFSSLKQQESPFAAVKSQESPFAALIENQKKAVNEKVDSGNSLEEKEETFRTDGSVGTDEDEEAEDSASDDLSDSTVEQTPFEPTVGSNEGKPSITTITEAIKKNANVSTANIPTPTFATSGLGGSATENVKSPFASFAQNLGKPVTPTFSISNLNLGKETTQDLKDDSRFSKVESDKEQEPHDASEKDESAHMTSKDDEELPADTQKFGNDAETDTKPEENKQKDGNKQLEEQSEDDFKEHSEHFEKDLEEHSEHSEEELEEKLEQLSAGESETPIETEEKSEEPNVEVPADKPSSDLEEASKEGDTPESLDREVTEEAIEDESSANVEQWHSEDFKGLDESEVDVHTPVDEETEDAEESTDVDKSRNDEEDSEAPNNDISDNDAEEQNSNEEKKIEAKDISAEPLDDLSDIIQEELEGAKGSGVNKTQSLSETSVQATPELVDVEVHTELSETSDFGVQAETTFADADVQTDPIETCSFSVQAFKNDENYAAEQYLPKPLKEYYTNAEIRNIPYTSEDPTMQLFESTYHQINAEFAVLEENIANLKEFLKDQCTLELPQRSEASVGNLYAWRISEGERLQKIVRDKRGAFEETKSSVETLSETLKSMLEKEMSDLATEKTQVSDHYYRLQYIVEESFDDRYTPLSFHQKNMQNKLRFAMDILKKKEKEIDEILKLLKIFLQYQKDPSRYEQIVLSLTSSLSFKPFRGIASFGKEEDLSATDITKKEIESIDVVQTGLELNTKREIGAFFKTMQEGRH
ncbi:FG-nucleoporin NUP159 KNAG_0E01860 [Huiozyma naganishii CBS 8797]|uniref:Nucleoporin Nup159/Nup146 N-terminal domain-containing protein n=1 Tax=Huiozyma naganishii (strain ATCC MYA-139 / BCRC 22969 / CBS 8797 / KCTC 17520 / NBRC 10181 / NCYC 3082 / Yp74L-3) TaxID=1071383 RepID=J7RLN7_HUIN7|nr:hypothetical protein KNAG_0E01860 [Kazachstania naganishii CBS 8797]CCK70448.1 hypothetical protein KNAG_0E01860 [Kazachstania naganishii CBS 8797]